MPPSWAACSDGIRQFTWRWRGTMRPAPSFNELRAERRAGVTIVRTAPVDGPQRSKDKATYDRAKRIDQADQAADAVHDGARWRGRSGERKKKRRTEKKKPPKPTKPLTLSTTARSGSAAAKGGAETQVRQKFSHGRTRAV